MVFSRLTFCSTSSRVARQGLVTVVSAGIERGISVVIEKSLIYTEKPKVSGN